MASLRSFLKCSQQSRNIFQKSGAFINVRQSSSFNIMDALNIDGLLTEEERKIRDMTNDYAQSKLQPRVLEASRNEIFHREIFKEMGELGLLGCTLGYAYLSNDLTQ